MRISENHEDTAIKTSIRRNIKSSFEPRQSLLDYEKILKENHSMRGFFGLFWMVIAYSIIVVAFINYKYEGYPLSLVSLSQMTENIFGVVLLDICMVLSLFISIHFQRLLAFGWFSKRIANWIQNSYQLTWFLSFILIVWNSDWQWAQRMCFTMHLISMMMKQHSYLSVNTKLAYLHREYNEKLAAVKRKDKEFQLDEYTDELHSETCNYPANLTYYNFVDYVLVPTLVYELHYPRTLVFRKWFFLERVLSTALCFFVMYFTFEHWIVPIMSRISERGLFESTIRLFIPFLALFIMLYYLLVT